MGYEFINNFKKFNRIMDKLKLDALNYIISIKKNIDLSFEYLNNSDKQIVYLYNQIKTIFKPNFSDVIFPRSNYELKINNFKPLIINTGISEKMIPNDQNIFGK